MKYCLISAIPYLRQYITVILHNNKKHFSVHCVGSSTVLSQKHVNLGTYDISPTQACTLSTTPGYNKVRKSTNQPQILLQYPYNNITNIYISDHHTKSEHKKYAYVI
jgi:hypothetical protein